MCELSLANFNKKELNLLWTINQAIINSSKVHQDGFGVFTPSGGVWKMKIPPSMAVDFGIEVKKIVKNNEPVLSHVRMASLTNGVKKISEEYSHPFETDKLVLAHNGSLSFKNYSKEFDKKYDNFIDSQIFLSRLDELYMPKDNTIQEALNKTMDEFEGKFAFLIYDKIFKKYYVVRGKSADLHYFNIILIKNCNDKTGEKVGFVINTEKEDLMRGILHFNTLISTLYGINIKILECIPEEIEKESIFLVDKTELLKVGTIKENDKVYYNRNVYDSTYNDGSYEGFYNWNRRPEINKNILDSSKLLLDFMREYKISLFYVDEMFLNIFGVPILGASNEDIDLFIKNIIPFMKTNTKPAIKKEWKRLLEYWDRSDLQIHTQTKFPVQFPYMLETNVTNLRNIKREVKKDDK